MTPSFERAMTEASSASVMHPATGELLNLADIPHDELVGVFMRLADFERQVKEWRNLAEGELLLRHGDRRGPEIVGDFEVDVTSGRGRQWDAVELNLVVEDLVSRGLMEARDVAGLVVAQGPKVDGNKARDLLNRSEGQVLLALRACFTWKEARPHIQITEIPDLADALAKAPDVQ